MATWEDVRKIALSFPETVERKPRDFRVKEKMLVWERPLRAADLAALGDAAPKGAILGAWVPNLDTKEALISSRPDVYFTTPHFDGYPAVLIRLKVIKVRELRERIEEAWLDRAPKRVLQRYLETAPKRD
ncbi:MAG: MmcQ/YjbR family DNA-binding protein [Polyangiaceae bacterium]|nr:MmcQ/YjbR family DNA-binding protein [Polyangiaceae bacterium]